MEGKGSKGGGEGSKGGEAVGWMGVDSIRW